MNKINSVHALYYVIFAASITVCIVFGITVTASAESNTGKIELGKWTINDLNAMMIQASTINDFGERIDFVSGKFLGTPYVGHTLIGDINTPEVFTIDLKGMDCFTYIDYVEALSLSDSFPEFKDKLKNIRYKGGSVAFQNRNHFFSDWPVYNKNKIEDVTGEIGGDKTEETVKHLNRKSDGTYYRPGIPVVERTSTYIPSPEVDEDVIGKMENGDYVGIYTDIDGLDVTHTGIIIKNDSGVYLRHASSKKANERVVDEDLRTYIQNVPGLVIYRTVGKES